MFEIEIKAWLDNPSETERIVSTFAEYAGASFKSDCYWYNEQQKIEVRVREEKFVSKDNKKTETILVTNKTKTVSGGMEVTSENEFQISDKSAFESFLQAAGFVIQTTKIKSTQNYYFNDYHIEIVTVEGIGQFIEAEILSSSNEPSVVEECRKTLLRILEKSGVPVENIEPRFYSFLQQNKINSKNRLSFPCNNP